jgi:hypothetical protein
MGMGQQNGSGTAITSAIMTVSSQVRDVDGPHVSLVSGSAGAGLAGWLVLEGSQLEPILQ